MNPDEQSLVDRCLARLPEVLDHLLVPGGKREGNTYVCGSITGGPGKSCKIELEGPKAGFYHDWGTDDKGDLVRLWQANESITFPKVLDAMADFLRVPHVEPPKTKSKALNPRKIKFEEPKANALNQPDPDPMPEPRREKKDDDPFPQPAPQAIDWDSCLMDFGDKQVDQVCKDRGYSRNFVLWLHEQESIGIYKGCVAFPVHDAKGEVVRIHYKTKDHWSYFPKGGETAPLVVGTPMQHAQEVLLFESQWDAFAVMDRLEAHHPDNDGKYCAYITRGANSNNDISKFKVPKVTACPQNDPPEKASKTTGRTPAEEWLNKIKTTKPKNTTFRVFETPLPHKDANDWLRSKDAPNYDAITLAVQGAQNPAIKTVKTFKQLVQHATTLGDDQESLIGYERRFLGRGGSLLIIGPSGIGKSSLMTSFAMHAAAKLPWNGIKFRKALRVLVIQAENDEGDIAEMVAGVGTDPFFQEKFTKEVKVNLNNNLFFQQVSDKTGPAFLQHLEDMIRDLQIDLVVIDPILSYIGDDISQQKVASDFFREGLQPMLLSTGVMIAVVHHTGKPPKDRKSMMNWSNSDFSYTGLGSSELVNWARAIFVIVPTEDDKVFQFRITKRSDRAGMVNEFTGHTTDRIYIKHSSGTGIFWRQTEYEPQDAAAHQKAPAQQRNIPHMEYLHLIPDAFSLKELEDILLNHVGMTVGQSATAVAAMRRARVIIRQLDGSFTKNA